MAVINNNSVNPGYVTLEEARSGLVKTITYLETHAHTEQDYVAVLNIILEYLDTREESNILIPDVDIKYEHEVRLGYDGEHSTSSDNDHPLSENHTIHSTVSEDPKQHPQECSFECVAARTEVGLSDLNNDAEDPVSVFEQICNISVDESVRDQHEPTNDTNEQLHKNGEKYTCSVCSKVCRRSSALKNHMLLHTGVRPFACTTCDKRFKTRGALHSHKQTHSDVKTFECTICGQRFTRSSYLRAHKTKHSGEEPFKCAVCHKTFIIASQLKRHLGIHLQSGEYKEKVSSHQCNVCGKYLQRTSSLKMHMRIHTGQRPFQCSVCDMRFRRQSNLLSHKVTHTGIKAFKCETCGKQFTRFANLKVHRVTHSDEHVGVLCLCNKCGKAFANQSSLNKHLAMHAERPHHCTDCNRYFKSLSALENHAKMHSGDKGHQCAMCNKFYATLADLDDHLHNVHSISELQLSLPVEPIDAELSYNCAVCSEIYDNSHSLLKHVEIHTDPNPHACEICNQYFVIPAYASQHKLFHAYNPDVHMETSTQSGVCVNNTDSRVEENTPTHRDDNEKMFKCACGKAFKQLRTLKVHQKQHTGFPYICKICNKGCTAPNALRLHMTLHTGERAHPCDVCDKRFRSAGDKKRHMRTHTGEKPYTCNICSQCFGRVDALKKHAKDHI